MSAIDQALSTDAKKKPAKGVTQTAFNKVVEQGEKAAKKVFKMREHAREGGSELLRVGEAGGAAFAAGVAKGYWGEDYLKPKGVPVVGVAGGGLVAWGIYETLSGRDGTHQLAFGTGLVCSELSDVGRGIGIKMAEKKDAGSLAPSPSASLPGPSTLPPEVKLAGPLTEIDIGAPPINRSRIFEPVPVRVLDFNRNSGAAQQLW